MSMHEVVLVMCVVVSLCYPSYNETFSSVKFLSLYQFVFLNQHDRSVIESALLKAHLPGKHGNCTPLQHVYFLFVFYPYPNWKTSFVVMFLYCGYKHITKDLIMQFCDPQPETMLPCNSLNVYYIIECFD